MAASNTKNSPEEIAIPISPLEKEQSPKMGPQNNEFEKKPMNFSPQSPEISGFSASPRKPPLYPTPDSPLRRRQSFKNKTRFGEPSVPLDSQTLDYIANSPRFLYQSSFKEKPHRIASRRSKGEGGEEK